MIEVKAKQVDQNAILSFLDAGTEVQAIVIPNTLTAYQAACAVAEALNGGPVLAPPAPVLTKSKSAFPPKDAA